MPLHGIEMFFDRADSPADAGHNVDLTFIGYVSRRLIAESVHRFD